ncbi:hypothetical protein GCM10020001_080880 [Nonomuraea salmonea]
MTVTAGGMVLHAPAAQAATTRETSAAAGTTVKAATTARTTASAKARKKAAKAARQKARAGKAVAVAKKQIGDPYRYGGHRTWFV